MLKYLVILLDDSSPSYCHYNGKKESNLIPLDILSKGVLFAMKHDLRIQYVLPKYNLPQTYIELINSMFHDTIGNLEQGSVSDIVVIDGLHELSVNTEKLDAGKRYLVRADIQEFFSDYRMVANVLSRNISLNVVFINVESFSDKGINTYANILKELAATLKETILKGGNANSNLLTDRIALDEMTNCGAGDSSITLAPDGKFYPCPAFYYDNDAYGQLGDVMSGVTIPNKKLYTLEGAPLCRRCDAYQCKRCVWLNKKLTYELNIPSRQQCVMAHVERNASRDLLEAFHHLDILKDKNIEIVDYLDPFDKFQSI